MPRDPALAARSPTGSRALNARYRHHSATAVLEHALKDDDLGRVALVSSFGAESVVLLHLCRSSRRKPRCCSSTPRCCFAETLDYQRELAEKLHLCDIRTIRANPARVAFEDPDGTLHQFNTDACCAVRKVEPLERALSEFDGWITGRKRYQGADRAQRWSSSRPRATSASRSTRWPIGAARTLRNTWSKTACPGIRWWPRAIPPSAARPAPARSKPGEDPRAGRWRGTAKDRMRHPFHRRQGRARPHATGERGMSVIVTERALRPTTWTEGFVAAGRPRRASARAVDLVEHRRPRARCRTAWPTSTLIRVAFPAFNDGRAFTIARRLREMGYTGRAARPWPGDRRPICHVAPRRALTGSKSPTISPPASPQDQWQFRADWRAHDYQSRLRA